MRGIQDALERRFMGVYLLMYKYSEVGENFYSVAVIMLLV